MYISSYGIQFLISPNLKYYCFLHNNKIYIYRERTFITEIELKGLNVDILSISNKGNILVLQNDQLVLYSLNEKNQLNSLVLNNLFKEGGILQNFALTQKEDKIFFTRRAQDKSIFAKLAKKEIIIQELAILNLSTKKEEVFLTKKAEKEEDLFLFKLSPFANYILVADPQKMTMQQINLLNYAEEFSFSIENVEIIDFFVNNEGDSAFILKEENKKGIYFIGKNTNKNIIKTKFDLENYTIVNFNPMYFVLKNKAYPEIHIINKAGENFATFLTTDIDTLGYPFWVITFPNYEDIIIVYLKQFKLPSEILFYNYSNFKFEIIRWKSAEKKAKISQEGAISKLFAVETQENKEKEQKFKEAEKSIEESIKLENKEEDKKEEIQETPKPKIDESTITQKILEEVKSEAKEIKYDPSSFLRFLEETEEEKENLKKEIPKKKVELPKTEESTKPQVSEIKLEIPSIKESSQKESGQLEIKKVSAPIEIGQVLSSKTIQETKPEKSSPSTDINLEKILSKLESKLEKTKAHQQSTVAEEIVSSSSSDLSIEIKKEVTPEDIEKLEKEKNEIIKKINDLKFSKSIGEISEEEYEKQINELKNRLQKIKQKLEKIKSLETK